MNRFVICSAFAFAIALSSFTVSVSEASAQVSVPPTSPISMRLGKVCTILRIHEWIDHVPVPDSWESQDCLELARGRTTGYPGATHYKLSCMTANRLMTPDGGGDIPQGVLARPGTRGENTCGWRDPG